MIHHVIQWRCFIKMKLHLLFVLFLSFIVLYYSLHIIKNQKEVICVQEQQIKELKKTSRNISIEIKNCYRAEKWIPVLNQILSETGKLELDVLGEKYTQLSYKRKTK